MKLLRTLRLDVSDLQVFPKAAGPGEWAVTGSFGFAGHGPEGLDTREKLAFKSGWLSTESFGYASLVEVAEISEAAYAAVIERLARHFVAVHGAPDLTAALPAAREEADYAASLCDHKVHTMLAIEREFTEAGIAERIRVIKPDRAGDHAKIWKIVPD